MAQRAQTTGQMSPAKLRVSSFPDSFPHYAWTAAESAHSDFVGSRVYACSGVTCHLHFWQNEWGLLRATAATRGWNGHRISQHAKFTLETKIVTPPLPGLELETFRSRVRRSTNKLSRLGHWLLTPRQSVSYTHLTLPTITKV